MKKSRIIGVTGCMGSGKSTLIHLLAKEIPVIDCDSINAGLLKKDHTGWKALKEAGLLAMSETGETDKPEMARRMFSNPAYKKQVEDILQPLIIEEMDHWKEGLLAMSETGETDKPEMARRMFSNPAYKKQVEDILQPLIIEEMDHWKEGITGLGAIEVPLLFECHLQDHFDSIWCKQVEDILQPLIIEEMDHWKEGITGLGAIEVPLLFECHLQDHFDSIWCVLADDVAIRRLREGRNISEEQARERLAYQFPPTKKAELSNEVLYNNGTIEELKEQMDQLLKKEVSALDRTDS